MAHQPLNQGRRHPWLAIAISVWLVAIAFGMKLILDHQARPGIPATAPAMMPASSLIPAGQPTLIVLAHPRCPCTRATLSELERIMTRSEGKLRAWVLLVIPPGLDPTWSKTDLWGTAAAIPGVRVIVDRDGVEARRFGTATSGQTLFYDAAGRLRFAGGITPGRGHAGDNAGSDAIVAFANHTGSSRSNTPVFGCALTSPDSEMAGVPCPK